MIQELKEKVGQEAERIIAQGLGLVRVGKKYKCPNGVAHKHGDKSPSMSWDSKALQFLCFACGTKIDIYEYYKVYENLDHKEILEKFNMEYMSNSNYTKPKSAEIPFKYEMKPISDIQIKYLLSRGISEDTLKQFQIGNENGNLALPYLDNGVLTGVKIRNQNKENPRYFSITNSVFGLFNKDNISKNSSTLIITEGEIDALVIYQCGFKNVVSPGNGGNSLAALIDRERYYINSFNSLIILSDNDETGSNMSSIFIKEFDDKVKLPNKDLYLDCKDMNEIFLKYGEVQIKKIVESAERKIEGLRNLDTNPYQGIAAIEGKYIPTGLPSIDFGINDLGPGLVTLITGRSNGGKSTLVNQVIANAINTDNKVLLISGEGLQEILINNLYKTIIGRDEKYFDYKKINKRSYKEPKSDVLIALKKWHKGKFTLFSKGDSKLKTIDELFNLINIEVKANNHNLIVIDNMMSVLSVEKVTEKYEKQADLVQKCCDLAKSYYIHIILVLHPNKQVQKGQTMDFEQISGSGDIYNKADNIIAVKKNYKEDDISQGIDGEVEVLKNRYFSDLPKIDTHYDKETNTLLEIDSTTGDFMSYNFKWKQYLEGEQEEIDIPEGFLEVDYSNVYKFK